MGRSLSESGGGCVRFELSSLSPKRTYNGTSATVLVCEQLERNDCGLTRTAVQATKAGVMVFRCHLRVRDLVLMERVLAGGACGVLPVTTILRAALGP